MAKRPPSQLDLPVTPQKRLAREQDTLLSPSKITDTEQHATVTGLLASLSPIKPARYFDGDLTDGESVVAFDKTKQRQRQPFADYGIPVSIVLPHLMTTKTSYILFPYLVSRIWRLPTSASVATRLSSHPQAKLELVKPAIELRNSPMPNSVEG